jgi:membrane protease YdiL (CAAX protease family)
MEEQVATTIPQKQSRFPFSRNELAISLIYLTGLIVAEAVVAYYNLELGMVLEAVILFALLVNSSMTSHNLSLLLRSMMALPIIRIIGLSIPLMQIQPLYWFPIIALPLFASAFTIMQSQGLSFKNVGFIWGNIPLQLTIALTGIFLGIVEFLILEPKPLIATFNIENLIFASIILIISTGLAEEILFRGIIQKNAESVFGAIYGLLYTSLLFTALHIGWTSIYDLIFVFLVAMFYGYVFQKTKSLFGITLSHGISNTFLFLVMPFYAPLLYTWLPF